MSEMSGTFGIAKTGVMFGISRDMAIDLGLLPPTAIERNQRAKDAARWLDYAERQRQADQTMLTELRAKRDPIIDAVLDLHVVDVDGCAGDDFYGPEAEPAEWPCRTVITLAKAVGIATREDVKP